MKRTLLVYCCCNAAQYRYHAKDAIHIIATVLTRFSYRVHISTSVYVSVLPIHQWNKSPSRLKVEESAEGKYLNIPYNLGTHATCAMERKTPDAENLLNLSFTYLLWSKSHLVTQSFNAQLVPRLYLIFWRWTGKNVCNYLTMLTDYQAYYACTSRSTLTQYGPICLLSNEVYAVTVYRTRLLCTVKLFAFVLDFVKKE